ncbi:MAG: nitrile hydratase accessory protein [Pseudomonadota bacterium]
MREADAPFDEPWQAQLFAMTVAMNEAGAFPWADWADVFGAELARVGNGASGNGGYWRTWLTAFERFLVTKGVADAEEVAALTEAWHAAARATPHGEPITL